MLASAAKLHVRQIKRTVEFLITNGVKTLNKLRAIKFEDLLFNNTSPQACCIQQRRAGTLILLFQAVKILIREALEAIQNEKRMRLPGTWERGFCVLHAEVCRTRSWQQSRRQPLWPYHRRL